MEQESVVSQASSAARTAVMSQPWAISADMELAEAAEAADMVAVEADMDAAIAAEGTAAVVHDEVKSTALGVRSLRMDGA